VVVTGVNVLHALRSFSGRCGAVLAAPRGIEHRQAILAIEARGPAAGSAMPLLSAADVWWNCCFVQHSSENGRV
jgi:hypothetical protein